MSTGPVLRRCWAVRVRRPVRSISTGCRRCWTSSPLMAVGGRGGRSRSISAGCRRCWASSPLMAMRKTCNDTTGGRGGRNVEHGNSHWRRTRPPPAHHVGTMSHSLPLGSRLLELRPQLRAVSANNGIWIHPSPGLPFRLSALLAPAGHGRRHLRMADVAQSMRLEPKWLRQATCSSTVKTKGRDSAYTRSEHEL